MTISDDADEYLRQRQPTLVWPVVSANDVADFSGAGQSLPESWTGAVVYLVRRWRWGCDSCLDSIHATAESAREREEVLHADDYLTIIDTEPIYASGANVVPIEDDPPDSGES